MFCKICGTGYGKMIKITDNDETIYVCQKCYEEHYEKSASEDTLDLDDGSYDTVRISMDILELILGKDFLGEYREYLTADEVIDYLDDEENDHLTVHQKCTLAYVCGYADSFKDTSNNIIKVGYSVVNKKQDMIDEMKGKILS